MENSRKYVLVPEERVQLEDVHLSELDSLMKKILYRKDLADSEKAVLYLQTLQKYVTFPSLEMPGDKKEEEEEIPPDDVPIDSVISENDILPHLPLKLQGIAKNLILFLKEKDIKINASNELKINGNVISHSNLLTFVNDVLRDRKSLSKNHTMIFNMLNFPSHLIKNKYLKTKDVFMHNEKKNVKLYAKPVHWDMY